MREKDINTIQNNNATYSVHVYVFEYKWTEIVFKCHWADKSQSQFNHTQSC